MKKDKSVWMVVHIARDEAHANLIREAFEREGLMIRLQSTYRDSVEDDNSYQIMVLRSEAEEARELISERGLL